LLAQIMRNCMSTAGQKECYCQEQEGSSHIDSIQEIETSAVETQIKHVQKKGCLVSVPPTGQIPSTPGESYYLLDSNVYC
jgi:hypothetical protein